MKLFVKLLRQPAQRSETSEHLCEFDARKEVLLRRAAVHDFAEENGIADLDLYGRARGRRFASHSANAARRGVLDVSHEANLGIAQNCQDNGLFLAERDLPAGFPDWKYRRTAVNF